MMDLMAKKVFSNPEITAQFIRDILDLPVHHVKIIDGTQIHNHQFENIKTYVTSIDVLVELNDRTQVIIEIQVAYQFDFIKRLWLYLCNQVTKNADEHKKDGVETHKLAEELLPVYTIAITQKRYFKDDKMVHVYCFKEKHTNDELKVYFKGFEEEQDLALMAFLELEKYNKAKQSYDKKVAEKEAADAVNKENEAKYNKELQAYNTAHNKYVTDKAKYDSDLAKYNNDLSTYEKNLAEYKILLKQFQDAKEAYDKYINDSNYRDIKEVETVQDLTFQRENNATHKIDGINTYLTREAQTRLNTSNVAQYDSNKLTSDDIVSTSPWANNEVEYIQIKEGDKFVVTYDGLNQSHMNEKDKSKNDITRVIYRYEIVSLPSNDGKGIAAVSNDPTVTLTVGASTDKDKPVKVAVDVEFYDKAGNKFDLQKYNCCFKLT